MAGVEARAFQAWETRVKLKKRLQALSAHFCLPQRLKAALAFDGLFPTPERRRLPQHFKLGATAN
jgi:hypothetical protein